MNPPDNYRSVSLEVTGWLNDQVDDITNLHHLTVRIVIKKYATVAIGVAAVVLLSSRMYPESHTIKILAMQIYF